MFNLNLNRICVLGNVQENLVLNVNEYPKPGETVRAQDYETVIESKAVNIAIAASRLDAPVWFTGTISNQKSESQISSYFAQFKVNTGYLKKVDDGELGKEIVFVDKNNVVRKIKLSVNEEEEEDEEELDSLPAEYGSLIMGSSLLMLTQSISFQINLLASQMAVKNSILCALDISGLERKIPPEILDSLDFLCMDQNQFRMISTELCPLTGSADVIRDKYLNHFPRLTVLIKIPKVGSRLISSYQDIFMPGFQNFNQNIAKENPIVDETGAYDTFVSAFFVKYLEHFSEGDQNRRKDSTDDLTKQLKATLFFAEAAYYFQLTQKGKFFPSLKDLAWFIQKYVPTN